MKKIKEIFNQQILLKSSKFADSSVIEKILKMIVEHYEKDDYKVFKTKTNDDDKIDIYLYWKQNCLGIIETDIKTDEYSYKYYTCCFLDGWMPINLIYVLHNQKFYDISSID